MKMIPNHKGSVAITSHAILRFLERVDGIDLQDAVDRMVPEALEYQLAAAGSTGKFPGPPGHMLVIKNCIIISVVPS